jgi:hypothetical protein
MPWFKVDDQLAFHVKALSAGNAALGLWVRAGSWSMDQLTDGFVPASIVVALGGKKKDADALTTAGLWHAVEGGWQFHDWAEYQPTKEQVEAERAATRERVAKHRTKRSSNTVTNAVTNGVGTTPPSPSPDLTKTSTRQSLPKRASDSTDVSSITEHLAGQHGVTDLALVVHAIAECTGRDVTRDQAWQVAFDILQRAKRHPSSAQRYVVAAIRQSPFEVQQFIDRQVVA